MKGETKFIIILLLIIMVFGGILIQKIVFPKEEQKYESKNEINETKDNYYDDRRQELEDEIKKYESKQKKTEIKLKIVAIAMFIAGYLLEGIAIYKLAEQEGTDNAWLAFIPIVQWYLIAKIAFDGNPLLGIIYILGNFVTSFIWQNNILELAIAIVGLYILHGIFTKFSNNPKHKLGNLVALEIISIVVLYVLISNTAIKNYRSRGVREGAGALVTMAPILVSGIYMWKFSKEVTE